MKMEQDDVFCVCFIGIFDKKRIDTGIDIKSYLEENIHNFASFEESVFFHDISIYMVVGSNHSMCML